MCNYFIELSTISAIIISLTLKYNKYKGIHTIKIWRWIRHPGGRIVRKFLCVLLTMASIICIPNASYAESNTKFKDVPDNAWYGEAVCRLTDDRAVDGFPDGSFKPAENVAVDQFIKMVVIASGNKIEAGKGYWAQTYIDFAAANGLVAAGEFVNYKRPITRGEMARMLVRALKDVVYMNDLSAYADMIADYDKTTAEYQEYILKAFGTGLMNGYPDKTFKYQNNATRAEAVTMILRLIDSGRRVSANDPANVSGEYTNYIEPQDLLRKVMELEMLGNFEEAYKYLDKGFTGNGVFTVEKYRAREELHVSYTYKYMSLYYPNVEYLLRCKLIDKKSDNEIVMAYCMFDRGIVDRTGDDDPYDAKAKTLVRTNGLWYIDLSNTRTSNSYGFKYSEGI